MKKANQGLVLTAASDGPFGVADQEGSGSTGPTLADKDQMKPIQDKKLESLLGGLIADGFNRSIGALVKAGALDTRKMMTKYKGMGSEYYDLVTEQIEYTVRYGAPALRQFLAQDGDVSNATIPPKNNELLRPTNGCSLAACGQVEVDGQGAEAEP